MKLLTLLFGLLISLISFGQTTIKGVVYNRTGPISGATVAELGTDKELLTNDKGEFELTLTTNDRTIFIGAYGHRFRTIKIKDDKFLKIKLRRQKPHDIAQERLERSNGSQQSVPVWGLCGCNFSLYYSSFVTVDNVCVVGLAIPSSFSKPS